MTEGQFGARDLLSLRGLAEDAPLLAEAIVDTIRESVLLLDPHLKVVLANRSFYMTFHVEPESTIDRMVYELGNGQWNIPELRKLLEHILPNNRSFFGYEVEHAFPTIGRKIMRLNALKLRRRADQSDLILVVIEDTTVAHEREIELRRLAREREALVQEMHHRVKNNLQSIAGLLSLQSERTNNPEIVQALRDAGGRVEAIAELHHNLYASANLGEVNIGEYLRGLIVGLRRVHGRPNVTFDIDTADMVVDSERASPLALIANELILNCLKHAFPAGRPGRVAVSLRYVGEARDDGIAELTIQDNGVGFAPAIDAEKTSSMGLELVRLLSRQLRAERGCVAASGVRWTFTFPLSSVEAVRPAILPDSES